MDPDKFNAVDPIVDQIAEIVDSALLSDQLANLRKALEDMGKAIGARYSANLSVIVNIFDREKQRTLPLLNTGLSTTDDDPP